MCGFGTYSHRNTSVVLEPTAIETQVWFWNLQPYKCKCCFGTKAIGVQVYNFIKQLQVSQYGTNMFLSESSEPLIVRENRDKRYRKLCTTIF